MVHRKPSTINSNEINKNNISNQINDDNNTNNNIYIYNINNNNINNINNDNCSTTNSIHNAYHNACHSISNDSNTLPPSIFSDISSQHNVCYDISPSKSTITSKYNAPKSIISIESRTDEILESKLFCEIVNDYLEFNKKNQIQLSIHELSCIYECDMRLKHLRQKTITKNVSNTINLLKNEKNHSKILEDYKKNLIKYDLNISKESFLLGDNPKFFIVKTSNNNNNNNKNSNLMNNYCNVSEENKQERNRGQRNRSRRNG